jgi:protein-S-isoprenylcysteine O-methyltransferase Ste14
MSGVTTFIFGVWAVFWIYWLISAAGAKEGLSRSLRGRPIGLLLIAAGALGIRALRRSGSLAIHSPVLEAVGVVVVLSGLGVAVWARVHLGRNWGMPMTRKADPELVSTGPYRWVRHPIYSGILLGLLGTALVVNLFFLIAFAGALGYFVYSATVEERLMLDAFPDAYPEYRAHTKMLIPFVL